MADMRVLHVDDDQSFGDLVADFLQSANEQLAVVTETSADDGLDRIASDPEGIDCIISDYDMPGTDGLAFLDAVRESHPDLPFILYTGKGSEAVASEAISKGATDYLQKGGGTEQYELLANRVRNAVEQYRSQRRADTHERITRIVRDTNRALVYADSVDEIERDVCSVLSDAEPYVAAAVADVDTETMQVEPRTTDGSMGAYRDELELFVDEDSPGRRAPEGRAYHDREIAVSQDVFDDDRYERWRDAAAECGFRSVAVVPLAYEETLYGLLAVFAERPGAFDDSEQALLDELGDDVAHAMHAREIRAELRRTASRLEALFERSPDMINVHDTDGDLIDPNPRLCEKTGYEADELAEMKVWDLDRAMDPDEARALWERMAVGESRRHEGEYRRADGSTFPVEVHVRRLDLEGDERFVAISRDISERERRQRELERYERIVENLPVGVFRTTADGELVSMNERFVSLYGGDATADFAGRAASDFYADAADREALLARLEREGIVEDHHIEMETLDGETKWIETTLRLTTEHGDQYLNGIVRDVTERRERTRRLEQAETLFENAQDALFLVDVDDEFTVERVNPAYEAATGLSEADLVGKTPRAVLGEESGAALERRYRQCAAEAAPLEYEETLPIDGERTHWETRIAPVVIDGDTEQIVGATRNITERKRREREFRRAERRYQAILEDPNILAGVLAPDGTLLEQNRTAVEYIDADVADVEGEPFWETPWWSEEMRPVVRENVERAADGEYVEYEADLTKPDGEPYSVEGVIRPVTDGDGEVRSLVVSARDVTERVVREQRLETILENTETPLFMKHRDGRYLMVNRGWTDLFGIAESEARGRTDDDLFPPSMAEEVRTNDRRVLDSGEAVEAEERIVVDGDERTFLSSKTPVYDIGTESDPDEPVAVFGVAHDITEQKNRERRLERQNERFDELASAVSHDLQTPLETARGRVEFALETGDLDHVEQALDALERTDELRENLVEVLRTKEVVGETEAVETERVARDAWDTVQTTDEATLRVAESNRVEADPGALTRLFENLFSNAAEHGGDDVTVRVGATGDGFFVADDGPGVPPEIREEVFTPGYSTKRGGSGVGLASVRQIVTAHGWSVSISESWDGGARFEVATSE